MFDMDRMRRESDRRGEGKERGEREMERWKGEG